MTVLTSKQATARLDNASNCICFFPFNEGSGTTFTDVISGAVVTDASATHTGNGNGPAIYTAANSSMGTGSFPAISATENLVYVYGSQIVTTSAFANSTIGNTSSGALIGTASGSLQVKDDDGTAKSLTAPTAGADGQDWFIMIVVDRNGNAYTYESVNGAAASLKGSVTHTLDAAITLPFISGFGNAAARQEQYGLAIYKFADSKTDYTDALDFFVRNWSNGRKILYPDWA